MSMMHNKKFFNQIVNISDGNEISIKLLARKIQKITNSKSRLIIGGIKERKTEIHRMKASTSKMKSLINATKNYTFDQGLIRTIDWYKKEKNLFENF